MIRKLSEHLNERRRYFEKMVATYPTYCGEEDISQFTCESMQNLARILFANIIRENLELWTHEEMEVKSYKINGGMRMILALPYGTVEEVCHAFGAEARIGVPPRLVYWGDGYRDVIVFQEHHWQNLWWIARDPNGNIVSALDNLLDAIFTLETHSRR